MAILKDEEKVIKFGVKEDKEEAIKLIRKKGKEKKKAPAIKQPKQVRIQLKENFNTFAVSLSEVEKLQISII